MLTPWDGMLTSLWIGYLFLTTDYQQVLQWGGINDLPARLIYEHVLPEVVARLTDPPTPYHRGSPYGGKGWDTSDPTIGDIVCYLLFLYWTFN